MKDKDKVKDKLTNELAKLRQRIAELEETRIRYKQAEEKLKQNFKRLQKNIQDVIQAVAKLAEMRNPHLTGHQRRVADLACAIAEEMGLPEEKINKIRMAAMVHDIGIVCIPDEVFNKPGRLTPIEFGMIEAHPLIGYDILNMIEFLSPIAEIVLRHHERLDGSGYPAGLSDEKILLEAKILAVADVIEAMTSPRSHRPSLDVDTALKKISEKSGIFYDPGVVNACLKLFTEKGFKFE